MKMSKKSTAGAAGKTTNNKKAEGGKTTTNKKKTLMTTMDTPEVSKQKIRKKISELSKNLAENDEPPMRANIRDRLMYS